MLRALVLTLAVLAGAKILAQDQLFRAGAEDALIRAYSERAMAACQSQAMPGPNGPLWTRPASVDVAIGRSSADVHFWQLHDALWAERFQNPHVVLTLPGGRAAPVCEYDVIEGRAYVSPM